MINKIAVFIIDFFPISLLPLFTLVGGWPSLLSHLMQCLVFVPFVLFIFNGRNCDRVTTFSLNNSRLSFFILHQDAYCIVWSEHSFTCIAFCYRRTMFWLISFSVFWMAHLGLWHTFWYMYVPCRCIVYTHMKDKSNQIKKTKSKLSW